MARHGIVPTDIAALLEEQNVEASIGAIGENTPATFHSTSVGHHNIKERYRLLTSQKVEIRRSTDEYCVTIPLIK